MGLFNWLGGDKEEAEAKRFREARAEESQQRLKAGGLPLNAVERLQEQRQRQDTPQHFWTSDLTVSELALVHNAGFEPLGQVMGSSVYHVGFQWRSQNW